jgi:CHASE2 domain-containing sensor protein
VTSAFGWLALALFLAVPLARRARRARRVAAAIAVAVALVHGALAFGVAGLDVLDHAPTRHGALASIFAVTLLVSRRDGPVARRLLRAGMLALIALHVLA